MERKLTTLVDMALDASPAGLVAAMRGEIVAAQIAYPGVLHLEVRDIGGHLWRLATQNADWAPDDPAALRGRSIDDATIDESTAALRFTLSDGSKLVIAPCEAGGEADPPNWELFTPDGLVLAFGPGFRWQVSAADARPHER